MKLYPTTAGVSGVTVDDVTYGPLDDGSFDVPDEVGAKILPFHLAGVKQWENEPERAARIEAEELERRRDPASLYDTVQSLVASREAAPSNDAELAAIRKERDELLAEKAARENSEDEKLKAPHRRTAKAAE